jgi:putative phosphoesterase
MKVLVISDSHGRHDLLRKAIGQEAPIDLLIHAGDVEGDLDKILGPAREYDVKVVAGNMDRSADMKMSQVFALGGHKVFLTHGHYFGVSYTKRELREKAAQCGCDIAIFGHTHTPFMEVQDDILMLNPGSVSKPRQQGLKKTYAVLTLDERTDKYTVKFKSLKGFGWT